MKDKILVLFTIILFYSCANSNQPIFVDDDFRLKVLNSNPDEKEFIAYKNIPLGRTKSDVDSIIKNDTTCLPLFDTYLYKLRQGKIDEYSEQWLYSVLGYGSEISSIGINKINSFWGYGNVLREFQEDLRNIPKYGTLFIDSNLRGSYISKIVVPVNTLNGSEYKDLNGYFYYDVHQDTVFSVSCSFTEYEDVGSITKSFIEILSKKYGDFMKTENAFYTYFPDTSYTSKNDSWENYSCKFERQKLNIIDAFAWIVGNNEVQLLINKVVSNSNSPHKYEFIVRYIDNDFLFRHISIMDKIKEERIMISEKKKQQEKEKLKEESLNHTL